MKEISVKFVDFWPSLDCGDNKFTRALAAKYDVRVIPDESAEKPDILFYSLFGTRHFGYRDCVKVYFTGENDVPDFNECDYALSFHRMDFGGRHLRYPLYMLYEIEDALKTPSLTDSRALGRGFCTALLRNVSNCSPRRLEIIEAVDSYREVTFGGPYRNNIGGPVPVDGKIPFIADYKFNLALENSAIPGYVTEKIVEPFAAGTVPIYWGAPDVARDFNPESYINVSDYDTLDSFIADLREIDNTPSRYLSILRAPRIAARSGAEDFDSQLSDFLCGIAGELRIQRPASAMSADFYRRNHVLRRVFDKPRIINALYRFMKK